MTPPMSEMSRLLKETELHHDGNPVARWHADCLESKSPGDDPDRTRPVNPKRDRAGKRIDGIISLLFAIDARMRGGTERHSAYDDENGLMIV
jgi:phage terminase large subunit-like protein